MADTRTLQIVIDAKNNAQAAMASMQRDVSGLMGGFNAWNLSLVGVGAGIVGLGYSMIKAASQFQLAQASMNVLAGSAEKANTIIRGLQELAFKTPFNYTDFEKASQTLLSFGLSAEKVVPSITMLADVAAGNREKFDRLSLAFAQTNAAGKLMGQDLLQYVNAGFNPLLEISKKTGESLGSLRDKMSNGAISAKMVAEAFKTATEEGGNFYKMSEKMNDTLAGKISNISEKWQYFLRQSGNGLLVFAGMAVDKLNEILDWLVKDAEGFNYVGKAIYALGQYFVLLGKTISLIIKTTVALREAFFDLAQLWYAITKDAINNFLNLGKTLENIFKAVGQALSGNFDEAGKTIKSTFKDALSNTAAEFDNFKTNQGANAQFVSDAWGEVSAAWSNFANLDGFESIKIKLGDLSNGLKKDLGGGLEDSKDKADKLQEGFVKLSEKISDFKQKGADAFIEVGNKIKDLKNDLNSLLVQNVKDNVGINQEYATAYVSQEKKVADLKAQWTTESDQKAKDSLFQRLQYEQSELEKNKTIAIAYQNEVNEARRVAGLSDIARAVDDLNKKRVLMQQEYDSKRIQLEGQLKLELDKQKKLVEILNAGLSEIDKINATREKMTIDSVNAEIKYWNSLAEAITRAKEGKTTGVITASASVQSRMNQSAPVVNINISGNNINGTSGIDELAKKVGDSLMGKLQMNTKLSL